MKIGIVCYPTYGGSGVVATELGLSLARRGHQIHIISYALPFRLHEFSRNIFYHEVPVATYPLFKFPSYDLALSVKMMEVAQRQKLDILHVHYAIPHAACAYLTKQMMGDTSPKIITTLHGTDITLVGMDDSFYPITKFSIEQSDGITAVSQYLKDETIRLFGIKNDIRVLYNFVDPKEFTEVPRECSRKYFAPDGEKVLMHISNFRPVKRIPDVIKVFAGVRAKMPAKLVLVGEGPELSPGLELARSLGVGNDVLALGKQDFLSELLPCADLYIFPSQSESFGLSALEALACGVPVIGSRTGGLPEVVEHGKTGFLSEIGDVEGMVNHSLELLSNPDKLQEFKKTCREEAIRRFNEEDAIQRYENYYREILESQ